jgi:tRNA A37 threonylcarbamoyltransferase TsaD
MGAAGKEIGVPVLTTSFALTTDNAAMIAEAGYRRLLRGETAGLDLGPDPSAVI